MLTVYTIGHSTRSLQEFVEALRSFEIERLVDVRTIPRSRHNPQFDGATLAVAMRNRRIRYRHLKALGGLRHALPDSPNQGWRNASFRGYADYMQTPAFAEALAELMARADEHRTAIMCAEAVPWRCHRSLIADALVIRGVSVEHIMAPGTSRRHTLNPLAAVDGLSLTYPAPHPGANALSL